MSTPTYLRKNSIVLPGVLSAAVYFLICLFYIRGPQAYSHTSRELFAWFFCIALLLLFWTGYKRISRADNPPVRQHELPAQHTAPDVGLPEEASQAAVQVFFRVSKPRDLRAIQDVSPHGVPID